MRGPAMSCDASQATDQRIPGGMRMRVRGAVLLFLFVLPSPLGAQDEKETVFWESVECESAGQVGAYLEVYPQGAYVAEAWACLEGQVGLDRAARILVQQGLATLEYTVGAADGLFGPSTRAALRQWQAGKGVAATGYLTQEQADTLMAAGREAVAQAEVERQRQAEEQRQQAAEAARQRQAQEAAAWAEAERVDTEEAYGEYLSAYPAGRHAAEAQHRRQQRRWQVGQTFRDELRSGGKGPELVVVPADSFMMGSPAHEARRDENEGPVLWVTIGQPFAVSVYEVTVGAYGRFVGATGHAGGSSCWTYEGGSLEERSGRSWRNPGFRQAEREPVVCVNWRDTRAYTAWLSRETGKAYRLLSEAEWEYVARAGTTTPFHFGQTISPSQANYDGNYTYGGGQRGQYRGRTVAVGRFRPNVFGLYDVHGNVWEWVQDCLHETYVGAPRDGRAWEMGDCSRRVSRGGSWGGYPWSLRSAFRGWGAADYRRSDLGFRIARSLP